MALIVIVLWDTEENKRDEYTLQSLNSILTTTDFHKHRLFISDNGSYEPTQKILEVLKLRWAIEGLPEDHLTICYNGENLGTSRALNKGLRARKEGEHCIKVDGDIIIRDKDWVDRLEEIVDRDPFYGIVGLKRKDLIQSPTNENPTFKSELKMLHHEAGQTWLIVEESAEIMGTATLFSDKLLNSIGLSVQINCYGFEDCLTSLRSILAGFKNCFVSHISIDHIDRGDTVYQSFKQNKAAEAWEEYQKMHIEYVNGTRPLYYNGE